MSTEPELIVIHSTDHVEAGLLKGLLENAGIAVWLRDEFIGHIAPWYAAPGGAGAVKIMVRQEDQDRARAVLLDFEGRHAPDE